MVLKRIACLTDRWSLLISQQINMSRALLHKSQVATNRNSYQTQISYATGIAFRELHLKSNATLYAMELQSNAKLRLIFRTCVWFSELRLNATLYARESWIYSEEMNFTLIAVSTGYIKAEARSYCFSARKYRWHDNGRIKWTGYEKNSTKGK